MAEDATALTFTAKCLCGQHAFTMHGKPAAVVVCHCTTCREHSGAPYLHTAAWPQAQVKRSAGDAGDVIESKFSEALVRESCAHCGGSTRNVVPAHAFVGFHLGVIADAYAGNRPKPVFKPACHLFYGSRVVDVVDGAPKMVKKAPADGMLPEQ